mmetsp:Transcript_42026/g.97890  ORF Transcript_42026/g.97890 Transcript_42026/m.97890 type:complete len:1291 (+) Transcript_42026:64-3936(+)
MPKVLLCLLLCSLLKAQESTDDSNETVVRPFVVATIEANPTTVQACDELVFSGVQSFDSRGEPLQFFWGFGPTTPSWFRTPRLSTILEEATAEGTTVVVISPAVLSEAGARLGEELREGEVRLEVRLIVRNALGNSTEALASAGIVGSTAQAEPTVSPIGTTDVQLRHSESLRLSVRTSEANFALSCASRDPGKSAGRTNVTWEYRSFGRPFQPLASMTVQNPLLQDLAYDPNIVELPPYVFQPDSFHLLRAVAAFDTRPTLAPRASVLFRIAVEPLLPLEVHITGPQIASKCSFELDASTTWDPTMPSSSISDFLFEWRCSSIVQVGELDVCANLSHFGPDAARMDGFGAAGPRLRLADLPAGVHRFSVLVRRKVGGPSAILRHPVQVQNSSFATLSLRFPDYGYTGKINLTDGVPRVSAIINTSQPGCLVPQVLWQWILVEDRLQSRLDRILPTEAISGSVLELRSGMSSESLLPGIPYYHVLLQAVNQDAMDQVVAKVLERPTLESIVQNDVVIALMSPRFVAEQPPSGGSISVAPSMNGFSLGTTFVFTTDSWADERPSNLIYEFVSLHAEAFLESAGENVTAPQVDWDDPSSPRFWKRLGGKVVRPWGPSPQALVHAPAGQYQLIVRARDDEGAVSMALAPQPLIVQAEHNLSVAYVQAMLAAVEVTNDVGQLLQASVAVAVTADPIVRQRECSTDFFGTLTCKQVPANEVARPAFTMLASAAPFIRGAEMIAQLGNALMLLLKMVSVPILQLVDVTAVFGDSLDPRNDTVNASDVPLEPLKVHMNASRLQIPEEFLTTSEQLLLATQERLLLEQASDPRAALDTFAAEEVLGGIAMILSGVMASPPSSFVARAAQQVQRLVDGLGASTLPTLMAGQAATLVAEMGHHIRAEMMLAKENSGSDLRLPGIFIPRQLGNGRQGCSQIEIQVTSWSSLNPRVWAPPSFGLTDLVLPTTSMKGVYLRRCGEPVFEEGLATPLEIDINLTQPEGLYPGYFVEYMCAVFDDGLGAWSTSGVSSRGVVTNQSTEMTCLASKSFGLFAALYRVLPEVPPNTTTEPPPPPEVDEGLTLPAIIAIAAGSTVCLCGCIGGLYALHVIRSREPVEPEPEEEEEEEPESDEVSEVPEPPDPDPALTKLRLAAEAGTLTAREILSKHSGPKGHIRQELVWALDKGYEKKRRQMQVKVFHKGQQNGESQPIKNEKSFSDIGRSDDDSFMGSTPLHPQTDDVEARARRAQNSGSSPQSRQSENRPSRSGTRQSPGSGPPRRRRSNGSRKSRGSNPSNQSGQ